MKKIIKTILLLIIIFSFSKVNALTMNEDGNFINKKGAVISIDKYNNLINKYDDMLIDILSQEYIDMYSNLDIKFTTKYIITTYAFDRNGNIIDEREMEASKEEAESVVKNENLVVTKDGRLVNKLFIRNTNNPVYVTYQTNSKRIQGEYHKWNGTYYINI